MPHRLTMVYWKSERLWLGKLLEHSESIRSGCQHTARPAPGGFI